MAGITCRVASSMMPEMARFLGYLNRRPYLWWVDLERRIVEPAAELKWIPQGIDEVVPLGDVVAVRCGPSWFGLRPSLTGGGFDLPPADRVEAERRSSRVERGVWQRRRTDGRSGSSAGRRRRGVGTHPPGDPAVVPLGDALAESPITGCGRLHRPSAQVALRRGHRRRQEAQSGSRSPRHRGPGDQGGATVSRHIRGVRRLRLVWRWPARGCWGTLRTQGSLHRARRGEGS